MMRLQMKYSFSSPVKTQFCLVQGNRKGRNSMILFLPGCTFCYLL